MRSKGSSSKPDRFSEEVKLLFETDPARARRIVRDVIAEMVKEGVAVKLTAKRPGEHAAR
jgi:hypothetical protein